MLDAWSFVENLHLCFMWTAPRSSGWRRFPSFAFHQENQDCFYNSVASISFLSRPYLIVYIPMIIDRTMSVRREWRNSNTQKDRWEEQTRARQAHTHTLTLSLSLIILCLSLSHPHRLRSFSARQKRRAAPQCSRIRRFLLLSKPPLVERPSWWQAAAKGRASQAEISFWARSKQTTESENFQPPKKKEEEDKLFKSTLASIPLPLPRIFLILSFGNKQHKRTSWPLFKDNLSKTLGRPRMDFIYYGDHRHGLKRMYLMHVNTVALRSKEEN